MASGWEPSIKVRAGKLDLDVKSLAGQIVQAGIAVPTIDADDALDVGALDWSHRDPLDRMLVAQCERRSLRVATRDRDIIDRIGKCRVVAA